jgi:hypothetical protein
MLISRIFPNILFFLVLIFRFLNKIIFLKFWHSILELFFADLAYWYGIQPNNQPQFLYKYLYDIF